MPGRSSAPAAHSEAPLARLSALTPSQRLAAIEETRLSRRQLNRWAARHPEQTPLVNGELPWIALGMADLD